jgi:hypothetical protein
MCSIAGLAYLIYKAIDHWRWGLKAGSLEPAFFTSLSYTHSQKIYLLSTFAEATIRGPGWGGVVVTRVDSPSANCEFDSRPHLRSTPRYSLCWPQVVIPKSYIEIMRGEASDSSLGISYSSHFETFLRNMNANFQKIYEWHKAQTPANYLELSIAEKIELTRLAIRGRFGATYVLPLEIIRIILKESKSSISIDKTLLSQHPKITFFANCARYPPITMENLEISCISRYLHFRRGISRHHKRLPQSFWTLL